jgi:large subunit ribosomal protein L9
VKTLGRHTVNIKLHADVSVEVPFDVVSENPIVTTPVEDPAAKPARKFEGKDRKFDGPRK